MHLKNCRVYFQEEGKDWGPGEGKTLYKIYYYILHTYSDKRIYQ